MSMNSKILAFITDVATDYKAIKNWLFGGPNGSLSDLVTANKSSVVAAINEVKQQSPGAPPSASETVSGVAELATQPETNTGTDDARIVTPLKMKTFTDATYQPVDSDLSAIAALTTTAYGRAFLALADQSGLIGLLPLDADSSLAANSDSKIATQKAVKAYADGLLDANNAYVYKGGIDASGNPNYPVANAGWTYKVTAAGKIGGASGAVVEIGDTITCLVDNSPAGNQAAVGANWLVAQTNIDGAVIGPASATDNALVMFSGSTGKNIKESTVFISTDGSMASNVDTKLPTEKAIRTYLAANYPTKTDVGSTDTDYAAAYAAAKQ